MHRMSNDHAVHAASYRSCMQLSNHRSASFYLNYHWRHLMHFNVTIHIVRVHCVRKKNRTKCFLKCRLWNSGGDSDEIWCVISRINLPQNRANIFHLTWIIMSVCIVKLEMLVSHVLRLRLGGLGTTYDVGLGLIGKRVVDFLLVLIELFFR